MNRNKQYLEVRAKLAGYLLAIAICLPACTGSVEPEVGGDASSLRLCLSLALPQAITVEPRDGVTVNGVSVTDVRVLQFASDGSLKSNKQYDSIGTDAATGLPTVTTGDTDFDDVSSRFYIVINTGNDLENLPTDPSASSDENRFLACTHTEADITSAPQIMVYGPYEYSTTTTATGNKKALQLLAKMQHIGTKIDVSWTIPSDVNLTITSAEVENIPDKYYLYPQSATSLAYKEGAQTISFNSDKKSLTFYMPENKKGTGTGTTQQEKSMMEKGPGGTLADCTCIVLKGTYKYKSDDTDPIEVEYRFYPGADMINNYDIERGKSYQLDITLSGANSADARVSITDSNVFSIGDPSGVDHTITF
jgi:hypothetical protein